MSLENVFDKKHRKQKLSTSSLPFLLKRNSSLSLSSVNLEKQDGKSFDGPLVTPHIREPYFGNTLGLRSNAQMKLSQDQSIGFPDLVHVGIYVGSKSFQYLHDDFNSEMKKTHDETPRKDDDGYVGYYHYSNGISFLEGESSLEAHLCDLLGMEKIGNEFFWKGDNVPDFLAGLKREIVVSICCYNIFAKSDFRARFIIYAFNTAKRKPIKIEKSYQIIPNFTDMRTRKVHAFSSQTLQDLSHSYWQGLTVSELVRLFTHLDNHELQLGGLVSLPNLIGTRDQLRECIKLLVKFLNVGNTLDIKAAHGNVTGSGNKDDSNKKTNSYRNSLVDTLIRVCQLDSSGECGDFAIEEICRRYYSDERNREWDLVILQILKTQGDCNKEEQFVELIHSYMKTSSLYCTQSALILQEQIKYLISKKNFNLALSLAKRCVNILPLDFDGWYFLSLCYILVKDYANALLTMNFIPIVLNQKNKNIDIDEVCGIKDLYSATFLNNLALSGDAISEKTFEKYFPAPKEYSQRYYRNLKPSKNSNAIGETVNKASIKRIWNDLFLFQPYLRHSISGNQLYQSPLMNAPTKELSSVEPSLIRLCGPSSSRMLLSSQSAGTPSSSIMDFSRKSTWGRCYDLLSLLVAFTGWDNLVELKQRVFRDESVSDTVRHGKEYVVDHELKVGARSICENWLSQLFLVVYEDLRHLMVINAHDREQHHSALEWNIIGLLGWSVKYNLKETISALMTSVMGKAASGDFDYFGSIKILEIYDEFVLSNVKDSDLSLFHDDYESKVYFHKLILHSSGESQESFVKVLEQDYLTLDFVILTLMRVISWNVRWYQYIPNYLVTKILTKLCLKYDLIFIRSKARLVFEQNKNNNAFNGKVKGTKSFFTAYLQNSPSKSLSLKLYEFTAEDTIMDYIESVIKWLEDLGTQET